MEQSVNQVQIGIDKYTLTLQGGRFDIDALISLQSKMTELLIEFIGKQQLKAKAEKGDVEINQPVEIEFPLKSNFSSENNVTLKPTASLEPKFAPEESCLSERDLQKQETIAIYQKVLDGEIWPKRFFTHASTTQKITDIITYLFEKLNITSYQQAKELMVGDFAEKYKLQLILKKEEVAEMLPDECYHLAWYVYPEEKLSPDDLTEKTYQDVLDNKRKNFPTKYFSKCIDPEHKASVCFDYLCRSVLNLDKKEIYNVFGNSNGIKVLSKYKLKIVLDIVYESLPQLLITTYPDIYDYAN